MLAKLACILALTAGASAVLQYSGVNESGYEWGTALPGTYAKDYIDPSTSTISYWRSAGANTFRYAFAWERAQPTLGGNLDSTYIGRISTWVQSATSAGAYTIIDPHNYARYNGQLIGSGSVSQSQYADLWTKLANQFKSNPNVIFGLMNEPHDIDVTTWFNAAQAAINAIRATGATNLILVPGVHWTGAHNWLEDNNAATALKISDPKNNYAFEVHQYFDSDFSGTHAQCTYSTEQLDAFTNWLKSNNKKGFLGEWAVTTDSSCSKVLSALPGYLSSHSDVYIGHTFWAAGPWWGSSALFPVEPTNGQDTALGKALKNSGVFGSSSSGGSGSGQTTTRPQTTTTRASSSTRAQTTTAASSGGSCAPKYGQCGGQGWAGATCCASGSTCKVSNQWYSQCL
uniref:cellulase n=1 Tax=Rhizophlyctis rosea TaxID=64517 RepID=A0A2U8U9R5_9FUNG|nr:glycoside hydrolase family 5 [Rhizophlyctis rosea]